MTLLNAVDDNIIDNKMALDEKIRNTTNYLMSFTRENNIQSLASLKQRVSAIEIELSEKVHQRAEINYIEEYKEELKKKSNIQEELDILFAKIEGARFDINMMNESLISLNDDKSNISVDDLNNLYKEVESYVDDLGKKFSDLLDFHNKMIDSRITFIEKQLFEKNQKLKILVKKQDSLLIEKQNLSKSVVDESLLSDLNSLNRQIDDLNVKKGEIKKLVEIYDRYNQILNESKKSLDSLEMDNDIDNRISIFNTHLSVYSKELYGESYHLVYDDEWASKKNGHPFSIENINGNVGDGKKRGLVVAFDLAYLSYINEVNIPYPNFIIHDKMEMVHINQLGTIFDMCSNIKGQYIVPIIKERINAVDDEIVRKATVLELSENNKFFKLNISKQKETKHPEIPEGEIISPISYGLRMTHYGEGDNIQNTNTGDFVFSDKIKIEKKINLDEYTLDMFLSYLTSIQKSKLNHIALSALREFNPITRRNIVDDFLKNCKSVADILKEYKFDFTRMKPQVLTTFENQLIALYQYSTLFENQELVAIIITILKQMENLMELH